jgi:hypothetical protein
MGWTLTAPIQVGDLDSGPYTEVKIVRQTHDSERMIMTLELQYGRTVAGKWVPGHPPVTRPTHVTIRGQEYLDLISANQAVYDGAKAGFYSFLLAQGIIAGGELS